jgi:hypothetical protein
VINKREEAVVTHIFYGVDHDHDCWAVHIDLRFDAGDQQSFGGVVDDAHAPDFARAVCNIFGVEVSNDEGEIRKALQKIIGRQCIALYAWGKYNEEIEGLEVDGSRFTKTGWMRKHFPNTKSKLDREREILTQQKKSDLLDDARNLQSSNRATPIGRQNRLRLLFEELHDEQHTRSHPYTIQVAASRCASCVASSPPG